MLRKMINSKWEARPIPPWTAETALSFLATRSKSGLGNSVSTCKDRQQTSVIALMHIFEQIKGRGGKLLPWSFRHQKVIFNWSRTYTTEIQGIQPYCCPIATSQLETVKAILLEGRGIYSTLWTALFWKYDTGSVWCMQRQWEWPVKLLNIQLKIQLNYSHNFAQIRVGKTTITDTNRANCTWEWRTLASTGHLQAVGLAGEGLSFDWRKTMLDWQQAMRSSSQRLHCLLQGVLQMRGGDAPLSTLLWLTHLPAWPKPCRTGYFFPGPPAGVTAS